MPTIQEIRKQYPQYQDLSDRALVNGLHKKHYSDMPYADFLKKIDFSERVDPTEGMSGADKFRAGAGKAFVDIGRGVKQITGNASQAEIDEAKKMDAPLMNTGAGVAGNIAGSAAMFAPTALIPGANTMTGAALVGGVAGAIQPTATGDSRLMNTGGGVLSGMGGQALGNTVGRVMQPITSKLGPEEQALANTAGKEGIPLSAGQATGSRPLQIAESVLENLPLTSSSQLAGRETQQRAFTAAALKRAGMTGDVAGAGELVAQKKALGGAMGDIADRNSLQFGDELLKKLPDITSDARRHLPGDLAERVGDTVDQVMSQRNQWNAMSGTNYQGWREPLRSLSSESGTGPYYQQIRKTLDTSFRDQLPGVEGETFRQTSREYANLKTIIDAMGGAGNLPAKGQIAPSQISSALARSVGKENKALGVGDLNELSKVGQLFVKDQIPNSGTAQRQLIQSLMTAGGGSGLGAGTAYATGNDPAAGAAMGLGLTGAGLALPKVLQFGMNSQAGQAYLKNGLTQLTPEARQIINALTRAGSVGTLPATTE